MAKRVYGGRTVITSYSIHYTKLYDPFLAELEDSVRALAEKTGRKIYLISESDLNDARVITSKERGGFGHSARNNFV